MHKTKNTFRETINKFYSIIENFINNSIQFIRSVFSIHFIFFFVCHYLVFGLPFFVEHFRFGSVALIVSFRTCRFKCCSKIYFLIYSIEKKL